MRYLLITLLTFAIATPVSASEFTGTLTTGLSTGVEGTVAATPIASPLPGTFTSAQSVTLTASGSDSIHYIIDGVVAPTCSTGTVYSGAIAVGSSLTIRAVACYNGAPSQVVIFAYGINISAPSGGGGGGGGSPPVPGDFNGDAHVDLLDFNILVVAWGTTGPSLTTDLNHDGVVDLLDFNILVVNWTG